MPKKTKGKYTPLLKNQAGQTGKSDEFNPDYSDVIKDLKRIGMLAGVFFAVLLGLSFFIS
jgi:hypothetical protein